MFTMAAHSWACVSQLLFLMLLMDRTYVHQGLTQELYSTGLVLFNDCICPGEEVSFECTTCEGLSTVWTGTLFNYCNTHEIVLLHSRFDYYSSGGLVRACNNGRVIASNNGTVIIIARGIGVLDLNGSRCYSSQLTFVVNSAMNNKTVTCLYDNGTSETVIDTLRVNITTESVPSIHLTDIYPSQLTFSWNQSYLNCPEVNYLITYANNDCGIRCPNTTTNTTTTCTDVTANGQECSLFVQVEFEVCGNIIGKKSNPLRLILKAPDPPIFASISYSPINESMDIIFYKTDSFNISDEVDGSATSYTIIFSDSSSGFHCGSAVIPAPSCRNGSAGVCLYSFVVHLSPCANSTNISVTAYSTNVLGNGSLSRPFYVTLDDSRYFHSEGFGQPLTLVIGSASLLALVLVFSSTMFITVTIFLVRSRTKVQRELQQARETIRRLTSVDYEEIDQNMRHSHVPTQENIAYGHICL